LLPLPAQAQQPTKVARIGYLAGAFLSAQSARIEAFRKGLRELEYIEGKDIVIEYRFADGKLARLSALRRFKLSRYLAALDEKINLNRHITLRLRQPRRLYVVMNDPIRKS
jgi:hypothetical protein